MNSKQVSLTISILIHKFEYPVHHLLRREQVALLVKLSMTCFFQPVDGLKDNRESSSTTRTTRIESALLGLQSEREHNQANRQAIHTTRTQWEQLKKH